MEIFTLEKLYQAYFDCRKNKRNTVNALEFEMDFENKLFDLYNEINSQSYKPGKSICFVVRHPSPREIFAADFRDRIVHHLLINEINKAGENEFIKTSYACRKNKGIHRAVKKLSAYIKNNEEKNKKLYFLQLDILSFFMRIDKNILFSLLQKLVNKQSKSQIWKNKVIWLAGVILFHDPTKNYKIKGDKELFKLIPHYKSLIKSKNAKGLAIGNYSSQFFANLYLNELDHFVLDDLKNKKYLRYVDDFILINPDKQKLLDYKRKINVFLKNNLNIELNLNKIRMQPVERGIDFLGYFIKPNYRLCRQKVVKRFKYKVNNYINSKLKDDDKDKLMQSVNSYFCHFKQAKTYKLRKKWSRKISQNFDWVMFDKNYNKLTINNLPDL